jgi:ribosome biogenesis GTPase
MPIPGGGVLIDTPGMRELGLFEDGGGIDTVFRDVADFATQCRFHDCTHDGTPDCAVEAAVAAGDLAAARLDSYRKIERELAAAARRNDPAAASTTKRRWRTIHKAMRARAKIDPRWRS